MIKKLVYPILLVFLIAGCNNTKNHDHDGDKHMHPAELSEHDEHDDDQAGNDPDLHEDHSDETTEAEGHDHNLEAEAEPDAHMHEAVKIQFTAYSEDFELFAEADPFVEGEVSNVLSHFTHLPDFTALESGKISLIIKVDGNETTSILEKPTKKGIYNFNIQPKRAGKASFKYIIETATNTFEISVSDITVYSDKHDAIHNAEQKAQSISYINTTHFTKEQSWIIDFTTEHPLVETFGQVIKTTAQIKSAPADESLISAKTKGIISISAINLSEGVNVSEGQSLFTISGEGLSDNNSAVRFAEAQNNYEKAKADYERSKVLATDKIISEKDLLADKNKYHNTKAIFESLDKNFNSSGQIVKSPMNGFINHLYVQNGEFVETGQTILSVSKNKNLILFAEIQQKYASLLGSVNTANIRTLHDKKTYSLEELNGRVLSYGRTTGSNNHLIPFSFQIENNENLLPGSFVEIYLKSTSNENALTVPNSALLEEQGIYFVFVQVTPELFEKREVKKGTQDGFRTEILDGISVEDRIVSRGAIFIKLAKGSGALDAHSGHVH